MTRRGFWTYLSLLVLLLCKTPVQAQSPEPTCLQLALGPELRRREAWQALLQLETQIPAGPPQPSCAEIQVTQAAAPAAQLAIVARWNGLTREVLLDVSKLPDALQPRAGALLASGLLKQLLVVPDAPAPAPETPPQHESPAPKASAVPANVSPPPARRAAAAPKASAQPAREAPASAWSLAALTGAAWFSAVNTPVGQLEVSARRKLVGRVPLQTGLGLVGSVGGVTSSFGRAWFGGIGARGSADLRFWQTDRASFWIAPAVALSELWVRTRRTDESRSRSSFHWVGTAGLRVFAEWLAGGGHGILLAADVGLTPRHLRVQAGSQTLVAYQGLFAGLALGYALALR